MLGGLVEEEDQTSGGKRCSGKTQDGLLNEQTYLEWCGAKDVDHVSHAEEPACDKDRAECEKTTVG